jgi:UDP-N-acetyl-2-amino-2-deoxyglucuronate dehydrogenase
MNTKTFALIGVAGYVAPKHLQAIRSVGGKLVAAVDPSDNVELLDDFFPGCEYFKNLNDFEKFIDTNDIDFLSICSPTFQHFSQIEMGLKCGLNVICESPLVLKSDELIRLQKLESETGRKVYSVLQYRYHPEVLELKKKIELDEEKNYEVELINQTYRGKWFNKSWKGDPEKSGGLLISQGYHFFDLLIWIFGKPADINIRESNSESISGNITLEKAIVHFTLSITSENNQIVRKLKIDNREINLSGASDELFMTCYQNCINNSGIGLDEITLNYLAKANL